MFLCEDCLKKYYIIDEWDLLIAPRSRGNCEGTCNTSAVCYDIPSHALKPKEKEKTDSDSISKK